MKDTDYLDDANFNQDSNSSILENVLNRTCSEIEAKAVKETCTVSGNKVRKGLMMMMTSKVDKFRKSESERMAP